MEQDECAVVATIHDHRQNAIRTSYTTRSKNGSSTPSKRVVRGNATSMAYFSVVLGSAVKPSTCMRRTLLFGSAHCCNCCALTPGRHGWPHEQQLMMRNLHAL